MSKQKKSITSIKTKILTAVSALVLILVLIFDFIVVYDFQKYY